MVVGRTEGGSYIIQELDGATCRLGVAAFRLIPYIARDKNALKQLAKPKKITKIDQQESEAASESEESTEESNTSD